MLWNGVGSVHDATVVLDGGRWERDKPEVAQSSTCQFHVEQCLTIGHVRAGMGKAFASSAAYSWLPGILQLVAAGGPNAKLVFSPMDLIKATWSASGRSIWSVR